MQNSFTTQTELFISILTLDSSILHSLDNTEVLLEWSGNAPEASTIGRFRTQLVEHELWNRLLAEVNS